MIKINVRVGEDETGTTEEFSASSIQEAVAIAQARYPGEEIRIAYPIDPETFFPRHTLREVADRP